jgi:acyl-CoA reductase-like NAD-dependent aldehyde dehydrogenase
VPSSGWAAQVHIDNAGSFIEPTVFDSVDNKMKIAQEEIRAGAFGHP